MVKLKVLTALKLPKDEQISRRVRTVDAIPKILSFVSHQQNKDRRRSKLLLDNFERIQEDEEEESKKSRVNERSNSRGSRGRGLSLDSSDDGSSIDAGDDEDQIYQQIIANQS